MAALETLFQADWEQSAQRARSDLALTIKSQPSHPDSLVEHELALPEAGGAAQPLGRSVHLRRPRPLDIPPSRGGMSMRAIAVGIARTERDAARVKRMLARGDGQSDIAG